MNRLLEVLPTNSRKIKRLVHASPIFSRLLRSRANPLTHAALLDMQKLAKSTSTEEVYWTDDTTLHDTLITDEEDLELSLWEPRIEEKAYFAELAQIAEKHQVSGLHLWMAEIRWRCAVVCGDSKIKEVALENGKFVERKYKLP